MKIKKRDDEIKNFKHQSEKEHQESILKSLKNDNEFYEKKRKSLNTMKVSIIITEILVGSALTVRTSTMGSINPGAGIKISTGTALITIIAILKTNEYISKLKYFIQNYEIGLMSLHCYIRKL